MNIKHRSLPTIIGLISIFVVIQACSLPIGRKTEPTTEVIDAPTQEKTEEIFLPMVEGNTATETEAETQPPTATPILEPTNTKEPKPGYISGEVFKDINCDGNKQPSEEWWHVGFTERTFYLKPGSCNNPGETIASTFGRDFFFPDLNPGTYCLSTSNMQNVSTPLPMDITLENGQVVIINIGVCQ